MSMNKSVLRKLMEGRAADRAAEEDDVRPGHAREAEPTGDEHGRGGDDVGVHGPSRKSHQERGLESITLGDLRDAIDNAISRFGDAASVIISADYGDRTHTIQAIRLHGRIEQVGIRKSGYSVSGYAVNEDPEDDDAFEELEDTPLVLLT